MDIKKLIFGMNWGGYSNPKEGDKLGERLFMVLSVGGWIRFPLFFAWVWASLRYYRTGMNPVGYIFLFFLFGGILLGFIYNLRMKNWKMVIWTILLLPVIAYIFIFVLMPVSL